MGILRYLSLAVLLIGSVNASSEWTLDSAREEVATFNAEGMVRTDSEGHRVISDDVRKKLFGEEITPTAGLSGCMKYNGAPMSYSVYTMIHREALEHSTISLFEVADGDCTAIDEILNKTNALTASGQEKVTSLMAAVAAGRNDVVERLLAHDVRLEVKDSWGRTALIYAIEGDNPVAVDLLLRHGAEYNVTYMGKTATRIAYEMGFRRVLDVLAAYGATL